MRLPSGSVASTKGSRQVDPAVARTQHPLDEVTDLRLGEQGRRQLAATLTGHEDPTRLVDPDLLDGRVVEVGLQRAIAGHRVEDRPRGMLRVHQGRQAAGQGALVVVGQNLANERRTACGSAAGSTPRRRTSSRTSSSTTPTASSAGNEDAALLEDNVHVSTPGAIRRLARDARTVRARHARGSPTSVDRSSSSGATTVSPVTRATPSAAQWSQQHTPSPPRAYLFLGRSPKCPAVSVAQGDKPGFCRAGCSGWGVTFETPICSTRRPRRQSIGAYRRERSLAQWRVLALAWPSKQARHEGPSRRSRGCCRRGGRPAWRGTPW